jgi:hypothetical protein
MRISRQYRSRKFTNKNTKNRRRTKKYMKKGG